MHRRASDPGFAVCLACDRLLHPADPAAFCAKVWRTLTRPGAACITPLDAGLARADIPGRGAPVLNDHKDEEQNRLSARAARYVRVGTNVGAVAARVAGQRLFGREGDDAANAAALAAALGGLKGPIMKVAQMLATIPEALPAEYAQALSQLQSQA